MASDENILFDVSRLKRRGRNVIIGRTVRIRYPELVELGDNVILDDFTYISTRLTVADNVHIASGCKLIGGQKASVSFKSFSTLAPGVVLAAGSDDYRAGIATPMVPDEFKGAMEVGHIAIGRHSIVGANAVGCPMSPSAKAPPSVRYHWPRRAWSLDLACRCAGEKGRRPRWRRHPGNGKILPRTIDKIARLSWPISFPSSCPGLTIARPTRWTPICAPVVG